MNIHLVSNGNLDFNNLIEIAKEVEPYIDYLHIREKRLSAQELYINIKLLLQSEIPPEKLIINDRVDVAYALGIKRVQLGYHSIPVNVVREMYPEMLIGCSVHSIEESKVAEENGADYILYGHIFSSNSKPGLEPRGCQQLREIKNNTHLPVLAIGGITPGNAAKVMESGADGIAVMSGIWDAENPLITSKLYKKAICEWREERHENAM